MTEIRDGHEGFDLVISDWTRSPQMKKDLPEGLRLLKEIRIEEDKMDIPYEGRVPVVFYHGIVSKEELQRRRETALASGATGTTGSPRELLRLVVAELSRKALVDGEEIFVWDE